MKKLLALLLLISTVFLVSCDPPVGKVNTFDVNISVNGKIYDVKQIYVSKYDYIFVIYDPKDTVLPMQTVTGVREGKIIKNVTTVKL